jgi:hypothetical protein
LGQFQGNNFSTFGEDMNGRLYIAGHTSGVIYYLSQTGTGFNDHFQNKKVNIYPNPFSDKVTIETVYNSATSGLIDIHDFTGEKVFSSDISANQTVFNLDFLPSGIYFVNLLIDDSFQADKLIKQ